MMGQFYLLMFIPHISLFNKSDDYIHKYICLSKFELFSVHISRSRPCYPKQCQRKRGRLRGLAVACWTTDHYHPCSNLGVAIYEGCFVFDFASLPSSSAQEYYSYYSKLNLSCRLISQVNYKFSICLLWFQDKTPVYKGHSPVITLY